MPVKKSKFAIFANGFGKPICSVEINILKSGVVHMKRQAVDTREIWKLMEDYYNSVYNADVDSLRDMFHEKAVMIGSSGNMLMSGTPEPLFREIASEPSSASMGAECGAAYVELKIHGNSAEARTYANGYYGSSTVEDYFEMVKEDGRWKIICKIINAVD